ncbi:MAG: imidazole glycerol phosphate synthase subunit HisH [Sphaerochaetaceae bacterium]|nr:imidazole glycerol phosphate synthase subunit HisH [Sphaerochaetaceae bacterium]
MIAIVKYNAGNIQSVKYALERLGAEFVVSDDPNVLRNADKIIFPGVGEASTAMNYLKQSRLDEVLKTLTQPFLGICLGLQLMCKTSVENNTKCLDIFDYQVTKFDEAKGDKIPHMGWNQITFDQENPLFKGILQNSFVYFVHSYYVPLGKETLAKCEYAQTPFSAALFKDNYYGVQFHPEKSGVIGSKLLKNFMEL